MSCVETAISNHFEVFFWYVADKPFDEVHEKCEKCDRTAYQKAKEKCDNRKSQLEKKFKNMTTGYESILFLLAWYSITITLFTAILSPVFLNDCITFFGVLGKGMGSLFREFVIGADSFGQLSSGIPNRILSGLMYWLIVAIVMGILSQSELRLPLLQVVSSNKYFSVGVQSPTEINAPRGRTVSGRQWFCAARNEV